MKKTISKEDFDKFNFLAFTIMNIRRLDDGKKDFSFEDIDLLAEFSSTIKNLIFKDADEEEEE